MRLVRCEGGEVGGRLCVEPLRQGGVRVVRREV